MVRTLLISCATALLASAGEAQVAHAPLAARAAQAALSTAQGSDVPAGLRCIQSAYPEQVCSVTGSALVLCSGERFEYDDGRLKSEQQRLDEPDLQDMMAQPYTVGAALPPPSGTEPGRARYEPLFDAMYGASAKAVTPRLRRIAWLPRDGGRRVAITTVNGVDLRLRAVSDAIEQLPRELRAHAAKLAGSLSFRSIAGTARKSAHSYGIAIDVAPQLGDYWRWRERGVDPPIKYRNRMPLEIVAAFEREGFIWGGRWTHYDTMHFEYRPELLAQTCLQSLPEQPEQTREQRSEVHQVHSAPPSERSKQPPPSAARYAAATTSYAWPHDAASQSLRARFAPPPGFERAPVEAASFGAFLRELPLNDGRGSVRYYDGSLKPSQDLHAAVIAIDTGKRDLQQCADAVMRLRAEFLFGSGRSEQVCFRAVSGDAMPYDYYRRGMRPPRGRAAPWKAEAASDASWAGFRTYLERVFGVANTASLARELVAVRDARSVEVGDVYIEGARGGRFGHAVIVLDVAENRLGERVVLIAQSYMPAQDLHVLVNPTQRELGSWYRVPPDGSLETPEWSFQRGSLRRFDRSCHP